MLTEKSNYSDCRITSGNTFMVEVSHPEHHLNSGRSAMSIHHIMTWKNNCLLRFAAFLKKRFLIKRTKSDIQTSSSLAGVSSRYRHWCPVRAEFMAERSTERNCSLSSPLSVAQTQERQGPSRTKAWLTSAENLSKRPTTLVIIY